ncbi:electron transfer flavoprotein subunit alpha [Thermocladium modestius]|uniref:Electron transfer flavoprotein subunit alpha n=1 Tax=Thermocladium modestius TaxID=62609 RepID=A0A830GXJ0_9CREN|nr:electron transfer flavoprotein subunit alpha [Thermocladium modestius]
MIGVFATPSTLEVMGLAQKLGGDALVFILNGDDQAAERAAKYGAGRVVLIDCGAICDPAVLYDAVAGELSGLSHLVFPATKDGKTIAGYIAGKLGIPNLVDVVDVLAPNKFSKYSMGNRGAEEVEVDGPVALVVQPKRFQPAEKPSKPAVERRKAMPTIELTGREEKAKGSLKIEDAELIVSVGRGFKKQDDLKLAMELAEVLGAQVGCSRPIAADLKWLSEDHWVGLSGHKVRPKMYMAIGISGQPQHIAGMLESRLVVAVNTDKNAPIFQYADYGVVEDLYKFVPVLKEKLRKALGK